MNRERKQLGMVLARPMSLLLVFLYFTASAILRANYVWSVILGAGAGSPDSKIGFITREAIVIMVMNLIDMAFIVLLANNCKELASRHWDDVSNPKKEE